MPTLSESNDEVLLAMLRREGSMTVAEMANAMDVTSTAIRQRVTRLMAQDLIKRVVDRGEAPARGRPVHAYSLTPKAQRLAGDNFADLAVVLWNEIRSIKAPEVRRGLLQRISSAFADRYRDKVTGGNPRQKMESLKELFAERRIPLTVMSKSAVVSEPATKNPSDESTVESASGQLPILRVDDCPYPELAEQDRGICALERMIFAELVDDDLRLTQCRLDGHTCCEFSAG